MNRIKGLEKSEAPWHLRWFYTTMRKMFGKDLTPVKQQMRVPGIFRGTASPTQRAISFRKLPGAPEPRV